MTKWKRKRIKQKKILDVEEVEEMENVHIYVGMRVPDERI